MAIAAGRAVADEPIFLSEVAILSPTTNAPAGATGLATLLPDIFAGPDDGMFPGTNAPILHVTTEGLSTGTYTVVVTDTSTNSYTVGTFNVTTVTDSPPVTTSGAIPEWLRVVNVGGGSFSLRQDSTGPTSWASPFLTRATRRSHRTFHVPPPPPPCGVREDATLVATTNAPAAASGFAQLFSDHASSRSAPSRKPHPSSPQPSESPRMDSRRRLHGQHHQRGHQYLRSGTLDIVTCTNRRPLPPPRSSRICRRQRSSSSGAESSRCRGLAPTNVVGISVSDSNDVVDLTGTFQVPPPPPRVIEKFIVLADTTNAPTRAMGRAAMEGEIDSSTNKVTIKVETLGLPVGTYTTSITDTTGTNTYMLGTFNVHTWSNLVSGIKTPILPFWSNTVGGATFPLPTGLDPTNVITIAVTNTNRLANLTGDFANARRRIPCVFNTLISLVPGPLCANLLGTARLHIECVKDNTHGSFSLIASGAPPKATLHLFVNGVQVGTVKTDHRGRLTINKLPKGTDLSSLSTIAAEDADGNVAFSASFCRRPVGPARGILRSSGCLLCSPNEDFHRAQDRFAVDLLEHIHDVCLVRPPAKLA